MNFEIFKEENSEQSIPNQVYALGAGKQLLLSYRNVVTGELYFFNKFLNFDSKNRKLVKFEDTELHDFTCQKLAEQKL